MSIRRLSGVVLCLGVLGGVAEAGQSSSGFAVGITIGKPGLVMLPKSVKNYTWNAAAISVSEAGFSSPVRFAADKSQYWFMAERDGRRYRVAVSKTTGIIIKVLSL